MRKLGLAAGPMPTESNCQPEVSSAIGTLGLALGGVPPPASECGPDYFRERRARVAYHVTINPLMEDGLTVEAYAEAMAALKPASISVDMAGPLGRVLLASLQARGLPAAVLEKRPRPVLGEVMRIEELSAELNKLKAQHAEQALELKFLREYRQDIRVLIERLDR